MRTVTIPSILLISCIFTNDLFAQPCNYFEDYANSAGWTYSTYYYVEAGECTSAVQSGTLTFGGGVLNFNNLNDGNDSRYYHTLGFDMYEDFWTVSCDVTPGAGGVGDLTAAVIVALTKGSESPLYDPYSICDYSNTDALMVCWTSDDPVDPDSIGFEIWSNDNGVVGHSEVIGLPYGSTYYLQFTRIAYNYMSLDVYSDPAHTEVIGSIPCYIVPNTLDGLNTLQHGNVPRNGQNWKFTGTVDNTCVKNIDVTAAEIAGPETICLGTENTYSLTTFSGADITWTIPAGVIYSSYGSSVVISDWPGGGSYELMSVINYNCFYDTAYLTVNVIDPADAEIIEEGFCEGGDVTIDVTLPDASYNWYDGDSVATHYFDESGTYWVELTSSGCSFTDTIIITEYLNPTVSLGDDDSICGSYTIDAGPGFSTYDWSTGATTQTITTSAIGVYSVTVADEHGCEASDEIELFNSCDDHLNLPNVFSPNEDGVNDLLKPLYYGPIKNYSLKIWNRYGILVFETDNLDKGWNGKYENEDQPMGTYVFTMDAKLDEKALHKVGNITLVR